MWFKCDVSFRLITHRRLFSSFLTEIKIESTLVGHLIRFLVHGLFVFNSERCISFVGEIVKQFQKL